MPCCEISDCAQMSKTIVAVRHFGLGGCESLETAVISLKSVDIQLLADPLEWAWPPQTNVCRLKT